MKKKVVLYLLSTVLLITGCTRIDAGYMGLKVNLVGF